MKQNSNATTIYYYYYYYCLPVPYRRTTPSDGCRGRISRVPRRALHARAAVAQHVHAIAERALGGGVLGQREGAQLRRRDGGARPG